MAQKSSKVIHDPSFYKVPPQNIEAEESLLSAILMDNDTLLDVIEILSPQDFYKTAHQHIFETILELSQKSDPIDLITLANLLKKKGKLEDIGGASYLARLIDAVPMALNAPNYARIIREKARLRRLIEKASEITRRCFEDREDMEEIIDFAENAIFKISEDRINPSFYPISKIIESNIDALEERQGSNALVTGVPSGYTDFDRMTAGLQNSDLIILAARPSMGKCCEAATEIVLEDGSIASIEEIYRRGQARILTLNEQWKFHITEPSDMIDDGKKPVFRLITALGRCIETTLTHPFLTLNGWSPLGELNVGDKIAVPRKIEIFGKETMRECEVKLLAYLIGDGNLTNATPRFTNSNPNILADFTNAVEKFGGIGSDSLTLWLQNLGIYGKDAHDKFIPAPIFKLPRHLLALFLNRLFATDGWASLLRTGQIQIGYASVSEKLIRQVQHLLLRFGIIAKIKKRSVKYAGKIRFCWQSDITDTDSAQVFIKEIGIFGKEDALEKIKLALTSKKYKTNTDLIPIQIWDTLNQAKDKESWIKLAKRAGIPGYSNLHVGKRAMPRERLAALANALNNKELQYLAQSDIYWDKIVSIEFAGKKQVYDLTIPDTHNFVGNDICVHNTAFALNIARNVAVDAEVPVAVFSLEMSKEQLSMRMLCSEARVDSSRLRGGFFSKEDWVRLTDAAGMLSEAPIFIDDSASISAMEIRAKARRLKMEKDLGLIIIDYLQLMRGRADAERRDLEISEISRSLKALAKELNVPVVALSQLNRKLEERGDKRPILSDLRESGSLEQDADVVAFIYRDEVYNKDENNPERGKAELIISKQRNGPIGTVPLTFLNTYTRFENAATDYDMGE